MKIVIDVEGGSDMDNELTVFLLQHKMKFTRLPDLQQADVSGSALPPAPCRVRITQCSYEQGWYRNLIGEEFDVDNAGGVKDYVLWEDYAGQRTMWRHIAKQDCVVVRHCC